jgi:ABC-2 type transport system ATP-binding protein
MRSPTRWQLRHGTFDALRHCPLGRSVQESRNPLRLAAGAAARPMVELHSLTKRYGRFTALADCTLSIRSGEVFGLLGPNGAGKTTLLRLLLGLLRPTAGLAAIDGLDCDRESLEVRRRVAYLPGEARFFRMMRGRAVLRFFASLRPEGNLQRALRLADRLDLDISRRVAFMSTGMRQKLGLCCVLSAEVPLLVLDEPTSNLDPDIRDEVLRMVVEAKAAGRTVLFSSHVMPEFEEVCDRVGILRGGRLIHVQEMSQLPRRHRISGKLTGPKPRLPDAIADRLHVVSGAGGQVVMEIDQGLSPLSPWLVDLPLENVHIESIGLRSIYERFHREVPR